MPFAGYDSWDDCLAKNADKDDPSAYCGSIKNKVEKSAANPYSPEGNPYVPPPVVPGIPDEMLDGPQNPFPSGLEPEMPNRPLEPDDQPPGTVARHLPPVPVVCRQGHRSRVAKVTAAMVCSACGSPDLELDVRVAASSDDNWYWAPDDINFVPGPNEYLCWLCGMVFVGEEAYDDHRAMHEGIAEMNRSSSKQAMEGDPPWGRVDLFQPPLGRGEVEPWHEFEDETPVEDDEGDVPYEDDLGPRDARARKVSQITNDIIATNPDVPTDEARRLAERAVREYPVAASKTSGLDPASLGIKVGDIFYASWGYDQTQVNFYEVVGLTGASVRVRQVAQRDVSSGSNPHSEMVPVPGSYIPTRVNNTEHDVLTKRLVGDAGWPAIKITESQYCILWDGKPKYQTGWGYGH